MRLRRKRSPRIAKAVPVPAPSHWRMRCMCGTLLEIAADDEGRRRTCETCRRRFDIRFTEDVSTGQKGVSLQYLTDANQATGETSTIGAGTTSFPASVGRDPRAATVGFGVEPELPAEAHLKCGCGVMLAVAKAQYEKRTRCPACGARRIVFLLYDANTKSHTLQEFSLIDPSTGKTQLLTKL